MKKVSALLALASALTFATPATQAAPIYFTADLLGSNENPANASPATGTALVALDIIAHTLRVTASFSGLTGTTTAAHIHCCTAPPGNVAVATTTPTFVGFPLGVTSGSFDQTYDTTQATTWRADFITANGGTALGAEAALLAGLQLGQAYLNIHTSAFGGGEIRGFLQETPEPATLSLFAAAFAAMGLHRRKHKQVA